MDRGRRERLNHCQVVLELRRYNTRRGNVLEINDGRLAT